MGMALEPPIPGICLTDFKGHVLFLLVALKGTLQVSSRLIWRLVVPLVGGSLSTQSPVVQVGS